MPQLNPLWIRVEAEDKKTFFEYKAGVYVTKDGVFHVDLDERLCEIAEKLPKHEHHVEVDYVARNQNWKIHCKVLGYAANFIRACAQDYLACEKVTERVIVYGHNLEVAFWVDGQGRLCQNGCNADGGQWFKGSELQSTRSVPFYSVGIGAAVYDKTTFKRKSGDTVTWEFVRDEKKDEALNKLNSFCHLHMDPERGSFNTMPYTVEAAEFFYKMLMALCSLAFQMDNFFGSPEKLQLAISQGARLLGPPESITRSTKHEIATRRNAENR